MAVVALVQYDCFPFDLGSKVHNLAADTLKVVFSNTAPLAADNTLSDVTQIAAGGGYVTGGLTLTVASWSQTGGVARLFIDDYPFTASGAVASCRYFSVYNDTSASDALIGYLDFGSAITMSSGDVINFDFDDVNGAVVIEIA